MKLPKLHLPTWEKFKTKFKVYVSRWKTLTKQQKISFSVLVFLLVMIPISVFLVLKPVIFRSRAALPATPPVTPPNILPNPVNWVTDTVSLKADDFYIIADGVKYTAKNTNIIINSSPVYNGRTTLELRWYENNKEMRLFMYFYKDDINWYLNEIRTYNNQINGDWIYYTGQFINAPLGSQFIGDLDLTSDSSNQFNGRIYFKNLRLRAFLEVNPSTIPTPTPTNTPIPTLTIIPSPLEPTPTIIALPTNIPDKDRFYTFINYVLDQKTKAGVGGVTLALYYSDQWFPFPNPSSQSIKGPISSCLSQATGGPLNEKGYCLLTTAKHHPYFFIKVLPTETQTAISTACSCQYALRFCSSPVPDCKTYQPNFIRRYFGSLNPKTKGYYGGNVFYLTE